MIISAILMGGLGNQLFQIFNALAYSLEYNKKCIFQYSKKLGRFDTYWDNFLIKIKNNTCISNINLPLLNEKEFKYNKIPYFENNFKFNGYFQSYKYFDKYYSDIIKMIGLIDIQSSIKKEYYNYFEKENNIIGLHFRLGDYKYLQHNHPVLGLQYYSDSIQYIISKTNCNTHTILYFCESQDNEQVKEYIDILSNNFPNITFIKVQDNIEDWKQVVIMSCCNHNIIANSTFSWWGAYFNSNPDKLVCYPKIWFGPNLKQHDVSMLCPDNWIKL